MTPWIWRSAAEQREECLIAPGGRAAAGLTLPGYQPLPHRSLERLQLPIVMRRAKVARCSASHAGRSTRSAPRSLPSQSSPCERRPPAETTSPISAQIHRSPPANLQVTALHPSEPRPVIKVRARQGLAEIDAAGLRPELPTPSKY